MKECDNSTRKIHIVREEYARSAFFWDITHRRTVITYWRWGTTYRSNLHGAS